MKRTKGVTEKILSIAKQEFLENSYENVSLRTIAEKAGSSKGAIYIRYPDKKALYMALIQNTITEFLNLVKTMQNNFFELATNKQKNSVYNCADVEFLQIIDFIYNHFDEFKLILMKPNETIAQDFIHSLVEIDVATTCKYININFDKNILDKIDINFIHLISQSFYTGIFEIVIHNLPKDEAQKHVAKLRKFYSAGWKEILDVQREDLIE